MHQICVSCHCLLATLSAIPWQEHVPFYVIMMMPGFYQTNTLRWIYVVLADWSNSLQVDMLLHFDSLSEHLSSPTVCIAQSLVFCQFFRSSLYVLLFFFFWALCCQFFFDLRLLITPLVCLIFSYLDTELASLLILFLYASWLVGSNKYCCFSFVSILLDRYCSVTFRTKLLTPGRMVI